MGTESDRFLEFYRDCYQEEIEQLARNYPDEQRALYIDYEDLVKYDSALAEDYLEMHKWIRGPAEDALLKVEHSADVDLQQVRVRLCNVPAVTVEPGNIPARDEIFGNWVAVQGYVKEASDVALTLTKAAFMCERCSRITNVPQSSTELQEPDKCEYCGQQGPFRIEYIDSEFEDRQTITLVPVPEADPTMDGELEVVLEDDLAGEVTQGERVEVVGLMDADQENSKTAVTISLTGEAVSRVSPQNTGLYSGSYLEVPEGGINEGRLEAFVEQSTAVLRTQTLDEFGTQSKIITPFLHLLGWNIAHPEVRFEYSDSEVDGGQADYALLGENESPVFIVEAKQEGENLDWHTGQLKKYMRVFQAQYGLLTNGERYLFFCANPEEDESSEVEVLDCALSDLADHRTILAAYGRDAIVGERTSLEMLAEEAREAEANQQSESQTLMPMGKKQLEAVKQIIDDLGAGEGQGAQIEAVYQRTSTELDMTEKETDKIIGNLQEKGKVYRVSEDRVLGV